VLFAAFSAFFANLIMNGLPRWHHPIFNWDRFARATNDGFFLAIEAGIRVSVNRNAPICLSKRRAATSPIVHEED